MKEALTLKELAGGLANLANTFGVKVTGTGALPRVATTLG